MKLYAHPVAEQKGSSQDPIDAISDWVLHNIVQDRYVFIHLAIVFEWSRFDCWPRQRL